MNKKNTNKGFDLIAQMNKEYLKTRLSKIYSRLLSYALFEGRPLTTRGRWINPLVFFLFGLEKKLPQMKKVEKPTFILGTGRSGTTILGILMSMHKDVGFLNEPKALWHSVNKHEDLIGSYTIDEAHYFLDANDANDQEKKDIHKLFGAYLRMTFSKRVVDKYPELIFRIPYVKTYFPDAKFLFLVRNGWDTCGSIKYWSERLGKTTDSETHDWWGIDNRKWKLLVEQVIKKDKYYTDVWSIIDEITSHLNMAALEWIVTMRQGLAMMKEYPESIMRVNYEELVESPDATLTAIREFCELKDDPIFIEYGNKVLKPVKSKDEFPLHPMIKPLFLETMAVMGY